MLIVYYPNPFYPKLFIVYIILEIIDRLFRNKLIFKLSWKNENTDAKLIVYPEELLTVIYKNYLLINC